MNVYITKASKYLPNNPIGNEQMETFLGLINQNASKARRLVLRNNGILTRYYALDEQGNPTHNNAQLTALAVQNLLDGEVPWDTIEVLSCGTSTPDVLLPSHTSMVHGILGTLSRTECLFRGVQLRNECTQIWVLISKGGQ